VLRAGGGSVRDSPSTLDQLLAGAGPEGVTYKGAVGLLGITDDALLDETIDALAASDALASSARSTGWSRPGMTRAASPPTCWTGNASEGSEGPHRFPGLLPLSTFAASGRGADRDRA
jgi:hypothetical protein